MNLTVKAKGLELMPSESEWIQKELTSIFATHSVAATNIAIWLCRLPSFGYQAILHCHIEINLDTGRHLAGESTQAELQEVIQRATQRACRPISKVFNDQAAYLGRYPANLDSDPRLEQFRQSL